MPYYKDANLLFIHIPKTGGTSLRRFIPKLLNLDRCYEDLMFPQCCSIEKIVHQIRVFWQFLDLMQNVF